jgi:hypothetical protein
MRRCVFCDVPLCDGSCDGENCPQDEDAFYVCRGTVEDSNFFDDPVAHVGCIALALVREPGRWHWHAFMPEPGEDPQRVAEFHRNVALLRSLNRPVG